MASEGQNLFSPGRIRRFRIPVPLKSDWFTDVPEYHRFITDDSLALRDATGDFYYQAFRALNYIARHAKSLTHPIFVGIAANDPICDNKRTREFFAKLPSADKVLIEYPDARHILDFSNERDRYLKDIGRWLERQEMSDHGSH
jgi:alpha-beta hydrolase superfamily lysophospholipase